jgi:hypothetical protein
MVCKTANMSLYASFNDEELTIRTSMRYLLSRMSLCMSLGFYPLLRKIINFATPTSAGTRNSETL